MKKNNDKIAIMQPYIFPYIGYFHLIHATHFFVFYDDVQYIMRGWINRNRIINQGNELFFTIPLCKASRNKCINEIAPAVDTRWKNKFYKQLTHSYKRTPYFSDAIEPVMSIFSEEYADITDMAIKSILVILTYLDMKFSFTKSSLCSPATKGLEKSDRLITITKAQGYNNYLNTPGGKEIYSKKYFLEHGVNLSFIDSVPSVYQQYSKRFIPYLSIIDIIMFNSKNHTLDLISDYSLE